MTIVSPRVGALNGGRQWQRRRRRSRAEGGLVIFRAAVSIVWCMFYCVWGHVSAHVPDTLGHLNPFISATTEKIFNATTRSPAPRGGMGFARPKTRISNMPNCRRSVIAQQSTVDEYQKFKYIIDNTRTSVKFIKNYITHRQILTHCTIVHCVNSSFAYYHHNTGDVKTRILKVNHGVR